MPSGGGRQIPVKINCDLPAFLAGPDPIRIELGCGEHKTPGYLAIDNADLPNVDVVADLEQGLPFLPDNSVDLIYSKSFFEHIDNFEGLMREMGRVLRPGGRLQGFVPHFSNPYYYSDPTHRRCFGLYTFAYFAAGPTRFTRRVPGFYANAKFQIESIRLHFTSPWRVRRWLRAPLNHILNASPSLQEFYEENLCYLIPCYGIYFTLRVVK
jgi:SAM-dependent methyltransferase